MRTERIVNVAGVRSGGVHVDDRAGVGEEGQVAVVGVVGERDGARGAAVEPFLHRPHLAGAHDLQQADVDEQVDVVGDAARGRRTRSASSVTLIARSSTRSSNSMRSGSPSALRRAGVSASITSASS